MVAWSMTLKTDRLPSSPPAQQALSLLPLPTIHLLNREGVTVCAETEKAVAALHTH